MVVKLRERCAKVLVFPLSVILLFMSVSCDSQGINQIDKEEYSGKEIFRGMFFGQGEVAELFPELWESEGVSRVIKHDKINFTNAQDLLVEVIEKKDSTFFKDFKRSMQSGDHELIREQLQYANNRIYSAAKIITDKDLEGLLQQKNSQMVLRDLGLSDDADIKEILAKRSALSNVEKQFLDNISNSQNGNFVDKKKKAAAAVAFVLAVAIAIALVFNIAWGEPCGDNPSSCKISEEAPKKFDSLKQEVFINNIANRLVAQN